MCSPLARDDNCLAPRQRPANRLKCFAPPGTQPLDYASKQSPRSFLAAATEDTFINPQRNTAGLANRLRDAGATVEMKLYSRVNHLTLVAALAWPLAWLAPVLDDVVDFINAGSSLPR